MQDMTYAYISVGFVVLMMIFFVPFMIKRAMKATKQAKGFMPEFLQRTGLTQMGDCLSGTYKGFPITVKAGMGTNYAKMGMSALSGNFNMHGRDTFFQKLNITVKVPGKNLPSLHLKDKVSVVRTDQYIQEAATGRQPKIPEVEIPDDAGLKSKLRVYAENEDHAKKIVYDPEVKLLLSTWHCTNINVGGDQVALTLDDVQMLNKFGGRRLSSPEYMIQAMNICTRIAQIAG